MRRRKFIKKATVTTGIVASACLPFGLARMLAPENTVQAFEKGKHLRPPGALKDDAAFVEACIGCGLCAEVCPPRCILFHKRDGGHETNTPYIDLEQKACTLCAKCMEVCPTESLTETPRDEIDMGIGQIDRTACYPWVDRGICGACVVACPLGDKAIGFDFANIYRPVVKEGCVGCGICVEVCPHPSLPIRIVERSEGTVTVHTV